MTPVNHAAWNPGDNGSISRKVVEALAEAHEVPETELDPLYSSIDPDALDNLVSSGDATLTVRWTVDEYLINVSGDGTVTVTERHE